MHRGGALLLLALLCLSAAAQEAEGGGEAVTEAAKGSTGVTQAKSDDEGTTEGGQATTPKGTTSEGKAGEYEERESPGKFFVNKARSTTTWTFISSFTSIVPYTCYTTGGAAPMACMGRRLRRSRKLATDWEENLDSARLYGSALEEGDGPLDALSDQEEREGKFFFKIWNTVSTTATVTTFSTNRSVTISVSILCTYAGITYNAC